MGPQHQEAMANLLYGIQGRKGFIALVGEPGTGKTILLESLMEQLKAQQTEFAFLVHSRITPEEFFELLAYDLKLNCARTSKASVLIALNDALLDRAQQGGTTVLIADDADRLRRDVLEEIELLGNLETRHGNLLQVVFAARPGFEEQLERYRLTGLRQRILLRARLEPLGEAETAAYIERRLEKAGLARQRIFSPELMAEIHARTGGIPRLISAVCGEMLRQCVEKKRETADGEMLEKVCGEMKIG